MSAWFWFHLKLHHGRRISIWQGEGNELEKGLQPVGIEQLEQLEFQNISKLDLWMDEK